ncbi:MAG: hypothetical protein HQK77_13975, partial [Desulfobacterales bacterium]|nr:hypothetical protein [Desulfobacterales bacterium]
ITTVERRGIEKGIEIGIQQGIHIGINQGIHQGINQGIEKGIIQNAQEGILDILKLRFNRIPKSIQETIQDISDSGKLKRLLKKAVQVNSLEIFVKEMDR